MRKYYALLLQQTIDFHVNHFKFHVQGRSLVALTEKWVGFISLTINKLLQLNNKLKIEDII